MIELPARYPCDLCVAIREERWKIVDESEHVLIVINPLKFEDGQCCVITRRHVATLLDLTDEECQAVMVSARRLADALVKTFRPLGILTFQNNGVFSGQETPHFHFHVVPRQKGSNWERRPASTRHLRRRPMQERLVARSRRGFTVSNASSVSAELLAETANLIRSNLAV